MVYANKSRILVQALILSPDWVPRSFVVSRGTLIGGMGRSWSVPIYILNGNFPDAFPADEDPMPFDGEPHPEHGLVVLGANHLEPNWQNELQGATHNLGFFGGNPHPNPAHLVHDQQINQHPIQHQPNQQPDDMEEDEEDNGWPAWNPAVFAADNGQPIPQHPQVPQDHLDLDLSGSSMRFLRGDGPNISLDQVFENISDDSNSSSSDATSQVLEDRARFAADQSRCANVLIFGRKGLPSDVFVRASGSTAVHNPIVVDRSVIMSSLAPTVTTGLEIVPWNPVLDVLAPQLLPQVMDYCRTPRAPAAPTPVVALGYTDAMSVDQSPADSGPGGFEFQSQPPQPIRASEAGQKRRPGRPRKVLSLSQHQRRVQSPPCGELCQAQHQNPSWQ